MLLAKEIKQIVLQTKEELNLSCEVKIVSLKSFKQIAKKSPLIVQVLKEGYTFEELQVPALILHSKKEVIYLCKEILNKLVKHYPKKIQTLYLKAVLVHELLHLQNKNKVRAITVQESMNSENRISKQLKKLYPELINVIQVVNKTYLN